MEQGLKDNEPQEVIQAKDAPILETARPSTHTADSERQNSYTSKMLFNHVGENRSPPSTARNYCVISRGYEALLLIKGGVISVPITGNIILELRLLPAKCISI